MSNTELYVLSMDALFDDVPVEHYVYGIYASKEAAEDAAKHLFGAVEWIPDELEWKVAYFVEHPVFYGNTYSPPVEIEVQIVWIRPYEIGEFIGIDLYSRRPHAENIM